MIINALSGFKRSIYLKRLNGIPNNDLDKIDAVTEFIRRYILSGLKEKFRFGINLETNLKDYESTIRLLRELGSSMESHDILNGGIYYHDHVGKETLDNFMVYKNGRGIPLNIGIENIINELDALKELYKGLRLTNRVMFEYYTRLLVPVVTLMDNVLNALYEELYDKETREAGRRTRR